VKVAVGGIVGDGVKVDEGFIDGSIVSVGNSSDVGASWAAVAQPVMSANKRHPINNRGQLYLLSIILS